MDPDFVEFGAVQDPDFIEFGTFNTDPDFFEF